jgi:hypothetical protein
MILGGCRPACQIGLEFSHKTYGVGYIVGKYIDTFNRGEPNFVLDTGDTLSLTYYNRAYEFAIVGDYVRKDSNTLELIIVRDIEYSYYPMCGNREYRKLDREYREMSRKAKRQKQSD